MPYAWSLVFCSLIHLFKFISGPLEKGSQISNEGHSPSVPLMRFLLLSFVSGSFLVLLRYFFSNLVFHFHLFDGVSLQDTQVFVGFIFSECSNFVVIW